MSLFVKKTFVMHSGDIGHYKIEFDAMTDDDVEALAYMIAESTAFSEVVGVPSYNGNRLAEALRPYAKNHPAILIVDDVLTTGASMNQTRDQAKEFYGDIPIIGVVVFARQRPTESWIRPLFQMWTPAYV